MVGTGPSLPISRASHHVAGAGTAADGTTGGAIGMGDTAFRMGNFARPPFGTAVHLFALHRKQRE
jgi:hypothetical protein